MHRISCIALFVLVASSPASADSWSRSVDGVRARLVVSATTDANKRPQLAIAVELENTSDVGEPITIAAGSPSEMLELTLEDDTGKPIPRAAIPGNQHAIPPYVLALPYRSTLRVELHPSAYEYVPSGRVMLRPFSLTAWEIPAKHGTLYLAAKLAPVTSDKSITGKWRGPLHLPRVALP
jgi:hypothetical protein